ncbi:hypothetical protein [Brevibacillus sp. HD3.3A]|uniref:hypothetical protein n=1 Tax=Brevibacillus sp. HD3.3A TaxID=2738979 RepID=UPI00156B6AB1|nr:hypothetical protein [Brevibacillus sp. HD3.3A]UED69193.1 hypothetical protein HP435_00330 [Brevibacillus sp. HD3.3A]
MDHDDDDDDDDNYYEYNAEEDTGEEEWSSEEESEADANADANANAASEESSSASNSQPAPPEEAVRKDLIQLLPANPPFSIDLQANILADMKKHQLLPNQIYRIWIDGQHRYFLLQKNGKVEEVSGNQLQKRQLPVYDLALLSTSLLDYYRDKFTSHNLPTNQIYAVEEDGGLKAHLFLQSNGALAFLPAYEAVKKKVPIVEASSLLVSDEILYSYIKEMRENQFPFNMVYRKKVGSIERYIYLDENENAKLISTTEAKKHQVADYEQMLIPQAAIESSKLAIMQSGVPVQKVYAMQVNGLPKLFHYKDNQTVELITRSNASKYETIPFDQAVQTVQEEEEKQLFFESVKKWSMFGLFVLLLALIGLVLFLNKKGIVARKK